MLDLICWALLGCLFVAPFFMRLKFKIEDTPRYKKVNERTWEIYKVATKNKK